MTDIAKFKSDDPTAVIANWMRNRNTIEYLGIWETLYNADFKPLEFDRFRTEAGLNAFTLSPQKWIDATNAKGIISKSGRYGGTFARYGFAKTENYEIAQSLLFLFCFVSVHIRSRSTRATLAIGGICKIHPIEIANHSN